ncbi:MAG: beta-ketoacyl-[acyl-carrier-protein] synthase family protein [Bacteroidales bacterium]|nr:beta-ketoacyl-[acyl-carrier-protein] synthase family protein [Bacteroidales bacterium]
MSESIVVTGMGIVTALGNGKADTMNALQKKQTGIGKMRYLQTSHADLPVGEVKMSNEEMRDFLKIPADQITTRTPLMGMIALQEAAQQAEIITKRPKKMAFINGTTVGGMEQSELFYQDFFQGVHTEYIAMHDCGAGTEAIADTIGGFDLMTTISTACSSAANAVILGANLIKTGRVDVAVVGGTEGLSKFHLNGFNTLMILDKKQCKPFDKDRVGLNLGEGAAYIVLEKEQSALERNVPIICQLSGYANTCDAYHQTASSPDGEGAFLAMRDALKDAHLQPNDIDYINAHGTGTDNNDVSESAAIERIFGENAPFISSTKSFTGHTTSAAGGVEAVISILALQNNFIPVSLNFKNKMENSTFTPVTENITDKILHHILTNSFGFGGNDSSLIFSKFEQR